MGNPVFDGCFADPFVWRHGDAYYAVGTGDDDGATVSAAGRVLPLLRSRDFAHWEALEPALVRPDPALGREFWAPAVAEEGGACYLYYSVGDAAVPRHRLHVAVAERPEGPYRDLGALMREETAPFAIDPHPFRDADGTWWLFYARDFLDRAGGAHAGTALVADRLVGMTRLAGEERVVLRARHGWTLFKAERTLYGRVWDWHTLEGPCVVRHDGRYYCFFSGACYGTSSYGVDYAVADRITGPWSEAGGEAGPRVLRTIPGLVEGPGHNSWVVGPDGGEYLAYHAWNAEGTRRQMRLDRLRWTADGPRCTPTGAQPPLTR